MLIYIITVSTVLEDKGVVATNLFRVWWDETFQTMPGILFSFVAVGIRWQPVDS